MHAQLSVCVCVCVYWSTRLPACCSSVYSSTQGLLQSSTVSRDSSGLGFLCSVMIAYSSPGTRAGCQPLPLPRPPDGWSEPERDKAIEPEHVQASWATLLPVWIIQESRAEFSSVQVHVCGSMQWESRADAALPVALISPTCSPPFRRWKRRGWLFVFSLKIL